MATRDIPAAALLLALAIAAGLSLGHALGDDLPAYGGAAVQAQADGFDELADRVFGGTASEGAAQ